MIKAVGVSEFVQDVEATFFTELDDIEPLMRPEETVLVADDTSSRFRQSRLFLEAVLRRTPLPRPSGAWRWPTGFLLDPLTYQQRARRAGAVRAAAAASCSPTRSAWARPWRSG